MALYRAENAPGIPWIYVEAQSLRHAVNILWTQGLEPLEIKKISPEDVLRDETRSTDTHHATLQEALPQEPAAPQAPPAAKSDS